jgi:hypothetical protein
MTKETQKNTKKHRHKHVKDAKETKGKTRKNINQEFAFHSFEKEYAEGQKIKLRKLHKHKKTKKKKKEHGKVGTNRLAEVMTGLDVEKELIELFKKPFSPTEVTARSDFYTYINYIWLMDTKKKAFIAPKDQRYYVQIDDFRVTQDKVYRDLIVIIEDYIKNNHDKKAKLIKNMYTSLLNLNPKSTRKHIADVPKKYEEFVENDDLWRFMSHINHNEMVRWACPIHWKVMADDKNAKIFRNYISLPELSLYDVELYLDDTT